MSRKPSIRRAASIAALAALAFVTPAAAQWTQVAQVPSVVLRSLSVNGDTLVATSDSTVFVSVDAGANWTTSAKVAAGVTSVETARVHHGRLYAGTYGQGVFVSDDFGVSWSAYNQGLSGGFADAQRYVKDLLVANGNLYAATAGASAWVRNLSSGGWAPFGNALEPAQAANMEGIEASPTRLLAVAGFNGQVFHRDAGDPDWTESLLFNDHIAPGLGPLAALWTGQRWLVGSNLGVFRSTLGQSPWTFTDFGVSPILAASFAQHGGEVFTHFVGGPGTQILRSTDDGASWEWFDTQDFVLTFELGVSGDQLFAARADGLWRRSLGAVGTPRPAPPAALRLALAGAQPARESARVRFDLPQPVRATLELFDVSGRRVTTALDHDLPAGTHEATLDLRGAAPGVYVARLRAAGHEAAVRVVRGR